MDYKLTLLTCVSKLDAERRKIVHDGNMKIDAETGEVLMYNVDHTRHR